MGYHQRTHLTITTCTTIIAAAVAIDAVIQWVSGLDCFVLAFPVPQLHLAVGGNRQLGWAFPHLSTTYCLKEPSLPGFETHHPVRTQAIIERTQGHTGSTIGIGKLVVNLDTRIVSVDDQAVHLTGKEYAILELLTRRKGTIVTREMLLNHLYGGMDEPELKIRCFRLQAAQKARPGDGRRSLHRNGMGPRLYASRTDGNGGHPDTRPNARGWA